MDKTTGDHVPAFGQDMRSEFMLHDDMVFLNHASYGGTPRAVHERQIEYLKEMGRRTDFWYRYHYIEFLTKNYFLVMFRYLKEIERHTDFWYRYNYPQYLKTAIRQVADFIGIEAEDTVLVQNVTKAINTVLKACPLQSGDAILLTTMTYGAVRCIARAVCERVKGAKVHVIEIRFPIKSEDEIVEKYEQFLQTHPDVKIAVVDHITSPTSVVLPVQRLVEVCHRHDVIVAVDGAHTPGLLKVDLADIDADFFTGNLHKWVYTPHSCAFLWMNPKRRHDWFKSLVTSAYEFEDVQKAFSYEGTLDNTAYLCAIDGVNFYNRIGGMEKIIEYTEGLTERGVAYLEESLGAKRLEIPNSMAAPNIRMLRCPLPPMYKHMTNLELMKHLAERFGVQIVFEYVEEEMLMRVSVQVYNTMEDFVKLADAMMTLSRET